MSKCRYNLSEECHNKDCVKCMLEKIKAEILSECPNTNARMICMSILDKYITELKGV